MLYHHNKTADANPQTISGRTSYFRVRLAFHHYPQLLQVVFNQHWFGPSRGFTRAAPCPWVDHSVSGVWHATNRPVQTRFRSGSGAAALALPHTITPRIILQKARCHPAVSLRLSVGLQLLVGTRFQDLLFPSRGASHLSLTILVHYRSLRVFSLREWSPQIHAEFLGFRITWVLVKSGRLVSSTGLSPAMVHRSREIRLPSGMVTDREVSRLP